MTDGVFLSIDLGTSSVRAGLVDAHGRVLALASRGFAQTIPRFAWAEQSASAWWAATVEAVRDVIARAEAPVLAVCACGQMHGTVLLDADGELASDTVLLWNDKRSIPQVKAYERAHAFADYAAQTANPATPAWPAFKLRWLAEHDPAAMARTATVLTPKDFINFRLTGIRATDWSEASTSFLADAGTGSWSPDLAASLGLDPGLLPPIHESTAIIGSVNAAAAAATGLREGIPVLAGGGDLPVALVGSGAMAPGMGSDIAGTSAIATLVRSEPLRDPMIANVAAPGGLWGAFTLVDSGGDAIRWGSAVIANGVPEAAAEASPVGANKLVFLPFLSGERLGPARNSRAQFFGLTAAHGRADLHRAVLEGVAITLARQFERIAALGGRPERFAAAGGGGRSDLWLRIKASLYRAPILVPRQLESGVVGCAILAHSAVSGTSLADAGASMVVIEREVQPVPEWVEHYARLAEVHATLAANMGPFYDALDRL